MRTLCVPGLPLRNAGSDAQSESEASQRHRSHQTGGELESSSHPSRRFTRSVRRPLSILRKCEITELAQARILWFGLTSKVAKSGGIKVSARA